MTGSRTVALRTIATLMALAAAAWGAQIVRLALQSDDGGPVMGVLCMAVPSVALLIGAGAAWTASSPRAPTHLPLERSGREG